jgi:glycosyltransferase involved in cell wall biosynthesis
MISSSSSVSIVLPVHNGEHKYLDETIESILGQSYKDFELLIVDDGSTDNTFNLLSAWLNRDKRIKVLKNGTNQGIIRSLNRALETASSDLIARIDCGEIADPRRIELQRGFLCEHPGHVLVSSQADWTTMKGDKLFTTTFPHDDIELRKRLFLKDNIIIHPAVMYRKIPGLFYRDGTSTAEDYDYWLRLSMYGKIAVYDEPLTKIRLDPDGTTYSKKMRQVKTVDLINRTFMDQFRVPYIKRELSEVKLTDLDILQQRMFHYFTRHAIFNYHRSKILYYMLKMLSGITSPSYMLRLVQMKVRGLRISHDPVFQRYLAASKLS